MPERTLHILGLEGFDRGSHRAVRESIARHSRHRWTWLTRPGRAWKWRMRTGAVELLDIAHQQGAFDEHIDAVFVTSMLSAADVRALLPHGLRDTPIVLYMHENQAAYPAGHQGEHGTDWDAHFALTNLTSVLAADCVLWNSRWNHNSFLEGIEDLLRCAPDGQLHDLRARIESKGTVIWPPVEVPEAWLTGSPDGTVRIDEASVEAARGEDPRILHNLRRVVWPHRWEHDKGPAALLEAAERWTDSLDLRWVILGEQFEQVPSVMEQFKTRFGERIDHIGYEADRTRYWRHLLNCGWVLSTARHEFFGIAVVEALLAGCLPWLPNALSYPELLPADARDLHPSKQPDNVHAIRRAVREHLTAALAPNAVRRVDEAVLGAIE